jgi:hypothetical protein
MGHQVRPHQAKAWRSGDGERVWLLTLIDTMEQVSRERVSRPGMRAIPCDPTILSALRLQLARPAAPYPYWHVRRAADFSLRN